MGAQGASRCRNEADTKNTIADIIIHPALGGHAVDSRLLESSFTSPCERIHSLLRGTDTTILSENLSWSRSRRAGISEHEHRCFRLMHGCFHFIQAAQLTFMGQGIDFRGGGTSICQRPKIARAN
jgi:hypothetical protein